MRTIVHIGQPKTGTTSIQHYLHSHRNQLSQSGLYVPDSLLGFANASHFLLNVYALDAHRESAAKSRLMETMNKSFFKDLESRLKAEIRRHYDKAAEEDCQDLIWSNEGLYLLNSEQEYMRLRALFGKIGGEVLGVCCFRDKTSYANSLRAQLETIGLQCSDDPNSYRYVEDDSWLFDYERKVQLLERAFDEVLILDYDPRDMVSTFMASIGYAPTDDTSALRLNVTAPTTAT